jgi:predicted ATP-dependent protease
VFEQSYGGVDGDSASSAELYALLSAIAEVPIDQSLAVTGSVNQYGEVQAIGGVNEKIEGFFDLCKARGPTARQGVLIPASNVKHLMLHRRVVEAAEQGQFRIFAVETIDQGLEILTGQPAGARDADGSFPEGSVNARVEARLIELADKRRAFGRGPDDRVGCWWRWTPARWTRRISRLRPGSRPASMRSWSPSSSRTPT